MSDELREQVQRYQELMQRYHALDEEIDTLLTAHEGHTENMDQEAMKHYRTLARQRDEVHNAMREMEQTLFVDDDTES